MQIPVLVGKVKGSGYRARGSEPFAVTAKGATREEALTKLRAKIQARLNAGTELVGLEVGLRRHPWSKHAGMFQDDPDFKEVLDIIAENRRCRGRDR